MFKLLFTADHHCHLCGDLCPHDDLYVLLRDDHLRHDDRNIRARYNRKAGLLSLTKNRHGSMLIVSSCIPLYGYIAWI